MNATESKRRFPTSEQLAAEAMINEGGAISQPREVRELQSSLSIPELMLLCFGAGLYAGWRLARG